MYAPEDVVIGHPLSQATQPHATQPSELIQSILRKPSTAQQPLTRAPGSCHKCGHVGPAQVSKVFLRTQMDARILFLAQL